MRALTNPMRVAGVALALTAVIGVALAADGAHTPVRLGIAGLLAVLLLWAVTAATRRRAAVRALVVVVGLAIAGAAALVWSLAGLTSTAWSTGRIDAIAQWLGLSSVTADQFAGKYDSAWYPIDSWYGVDLGTGAAVLATAAGVLLGGLCVLPLRFAAGVSGGRPGSLERRVLIAVPFGALAAGCLLAGAQVAAALTVVAAIWLDLALAQLVAADDA